MQRFFYVNLFFVMLTVELRTMGMLCTTQYSAIYVASF